MTGIFFFLNGEIYLMQLTDGWKTERCLPLMVQFPTDYYVTVTETH